MQEARNIMKYVTEFERDREILYALEEGEVYSENFFLRQLKRRYPKLLRWKEDGESYKHFYLRMIRSISILWEQYGIPYIPVSDFNPEFFYFNEREAGDIYGGALIYALELGDKYLLEYLLGKGAKVSIYTFEAIGRIGSIPLLQFFLPYLRRQEWLINVLHYAKRFGRRALTNYLLEKGVTEPQL